MDDHQHRWFIFETKTAFEPFDKQAEIFEQAAWRDVRPEGELYLRIEYAVMGCSCGEVQKKRIRHGDDSSA